MTRSEKRTRVIRVTDDGTRDARADMLATEEPLEIRVNGRRLAVTMRTPSEDFSLAAGFLLSEGVVTDDEQISSIRYCRKDFGPGAEDGDNTIDVVLQPWVLPLLPFQERNVMMSSACGMCGRTSIDQVHQKSQFSTSEDPLRLSEEFVLRMPQVLRDRQKVFDHTGGLHAAGLFDGRTGELVAVREDVGRHNAVDKVLGWRDGDGCPGCVKRRQCRGWNGCWKGSSSCGLRRSGRHSGLRDVAVYCWPLRQCDVHIRSAVRLPRDVERLPGRRGRARCARRVLSSH